VHDLDGLAAASRLRPDATVVVADNDGGGIFHFLPQAGLAEHFERHFGTPHGLDLAAVAAALGIPASRVTDPADLDRVLAAPPDGPRLVVVPVDRTRNVAVRAAFIDRVRDALRG
jgi:2-succinyl-5-enolpyruvyl-6-hydroxy-3-cyclohexene-1-carboxylate synthase